MPYGRALGLKAAILYYAMHARCYIVNCALITFYKFEINYYSFKFLITFITVILIIIRGVNIICNQSRAGFFDRLRLIIAVCWLSIT